MLSPHAQSSSCRTRDDLHIFTPQEMEPVNVPVSDSAKSLT